MNILGAPAVVFSYLKEDIDFVEMTRLNFTSNGVNAWMDKSSTPAGATWRDEFAAALKSANICVSFFSRSSEQSQQRVFFDELSLIEARLNTDKSFKFVPVRIDNAEIPSLPFKKGNLQDLHFIDLGAPRTEHGLNMLLEAVGVKRPKLSFSPKVRVVIRRIDGLREQGRKFRLQYRLNDKILVECAAPRHETLLEAGSYEFVCSLFYAMSSPLGRGGYLWMARAEPKKIEIKPFGLYEWIVDAGSVRRMTVNPGMALVRLPLRMIGAESVLPEKYETWPATIKSEIVPRALNDPPSEPDPEEVVHFVSYEEKGGD